MAKKENAEKLEAFQITELAQVKALSHPLRMRIIEVFAESEPMTTKQVAESLGEKPTRLYHHVEQLEKAGLIRLTHTRQNRGATEKYYEAIARQFSAGVDAFKDEDPKAQKSALRPMINTIFSTTTAELLRLGANLGNNDLIEEEALLSFVEMHITQEQIDVVRDKLKDVLDYLQGLSDADDDSEELRRFRMTMAYYPLDRFEPSS